VTVKSTVFRNVTLIPPAEIRKLMLQDGSSAFLRKFGDPFELHGVTSQKIVKDKVLRVPN
jgi:hypothetical protein